VRNLFFSLAVLAVGASTALLLLGGATAVAGTGIYCTAAPNPSPVGDEVIVRAYGLSNNGGKVWGDEIWPDGSEMTFPLGKGSTAFGTRPPLAGSYTYAFVTYGANGAKRLIASCPGTAF
jgi:hypothetical protein